ncbi:MAG: gas vesicle protein [Planctomycetota bacterium]
MQTQPKTTTGGSSVADLLERILDKGVVIAGDVKVKLVDIELLTIQIRLVVCSIDKAKEMGMDWWANSSIFADASKPGEREQLKQREAEVDALQDRVKQLEDLVRASTGNALPEAGGANAPAADGESADPQSPTWMTPMSPLPEAPKAPPA